MRSWCHHRPTQISLTLSLSSFGWKCPQKDSGDPPKRPPWDTRERARKGPLGQLVHNGHSVEDSSRKCGVASIRFHSPISLTLPLSSFGWLRNNSSSHRRSASFRNAVLRNRFETWSRSECGTSAQQTSRFLLFSERVTRTRRDKKVIGAMKQ